MRRWDVRGKGVEGKINRNGGLVGVYCPFSLLSNPGVGGLELGRGTVGFKCDLPGVFVSFPPFDGTTAGFTAGIRFQDYSFAISVHL